MKQYRFYTAVIACVCIAAGCSQQSQESAPQNPTQAEQSSQPMPLQDMKAVIAQSSDQAIAYAKKLASVAEKKEYLLGQIQKFYDTEQFQSAVDIAQHVLSAVDPDSQQAKDWLAKAQSALEAKVQEKVGEMEQAITSTFQKQE